MTAKRLHSLEEIAQYGAGLFKVTRLPGPAAAERAAQILAAALQAQEASGEEKQPAA